MERPEQGERPQAEPDVFDAVQEAEDLKWDQSKQGFLRYWVQKFAERPPMDLPRDIQAIVRTMNRNLTAEKKTKIPPEQNGILTKYISNHIKELKERRRDAPKPKNAIAASVEEMRSSVEDTRADEEAKLGHGLLPESPEREAQDFKNPTTKAAWKEYWLPRLKEEADSLPGELSTIVGSGETQLSPEDVSTIKQYVDARLRALSFNLVKRKEMNKLKEELRGIDERDEMDPEEVISRRTVSYDEASGELYVQEHGERKRVTEGDIAADMIWGVKYRPDSYVPPAVWRRLRKFSAIKETRAKIENIWNRELSVREGVGLPTTSYTPEFVEENPQSGVVAERMIQGLLTKIQYDHPETDLRVEPSNALEDHELKYDFKIVFPQKVRGVALQDEGGTREGYVTEKKRLGIQFTIDTSKTDHKTRQILKAKQKLGQERFKSSVARPVGDIVLVSVQMNDVGTAFKKWLADGKPTGGPVRYLPKDQKREMLESVTENVPGFDRSVLEEAL
jgi:hypothetical protein